MKKFIIILLTVHCSLLTVHVCAQSCLPEGITFTTQAEIDNFQINYPNCTEIEGDVEIAGMGQNIYNLIGLNVLTSIGGNLNIWGCWTLNSLDGLNNLTTIGGYFQSSVNGLTSLSGLSALTTIGGFLDSYGGSFTNLSGLENLTSIGGYLSIYGNDALTSLTGLDNLAAESISDLYIRNNSSLSVCDIQSICDYLISPNGSVIIYGNLEGCNSPPEIAAACNINLPCLPFGNYYFSSQAEIDDFQVNYPGCTDLKGDVIISWGYDITNLNGLNSITSIQGALQIDHNAVLSSLEGLINLDSIGGTFTCDGNPSLMSLAGLENLVYVGGDFIIGNTEVLYSLSGLCNLNNIDGNFIIAGNEILDDLTGLINLFSIEGHIEIYGNYSLSSLAGLDNVDYNTITGLFIYENPELSYCEVQSICDYILNPNGIIDIYDNATGCDNPIQVLAACIPEPCLPEGIVFNTQQAIDSFQFNYPNCTEIEGDVEILGGDIYNLNGLIVLTSIGGNLKIGEWSGGNPYLSTLNGLNNLSAIGGNLIIDGNDVLINISALEILTTIGGNLQIYDNDALMSVTGLEALTSIDSNLAIGNNDALTSLSGLENINAASISNLWIAGNISLSICEVQSICDYLANPNGLVQIQNNASGCDSPEEVEAACLTMVEEFKTENGMTIIPNPSNENITISSPAITGNTQLSIFNVSGEKVLERQLSNTETQLDISALPRGVYFVRVQNEEMTQVTKLVKQ